MVKRLTLAQALQLGLKGDKRNKFGAIAVRQGGRRFASKAEARRDAELDLQQRAGLISDLKRQVPFKLVVKGVLICTYVADWTYTEGDKEVVEDKKGVKTPAFVIKWALGKVLFPGRLWRLS